MEGVGVSLRGVGERGEREGTVRGVGIRDF